MGSGDPTWARSGRLVALLCVATAAHAATITINSVADNTTAGDTACTLREAITNVNAASDTTDHDCAAGTGLGDAIVFDLPLPASIVLTTHAELALSNDLSISGPTSGLVALDGQGHRVLKVIAGTVTIHDLTINNGRISSGENDLEGGAAIRVEKGASMVLRNCTLSGNATYLNAGGGGAISNDGIMTLNNCRLLGNSSEGSCGAAIANAGTMVLTNCSLSGNSTDVGGCGGAIANSGTMVLTSCTLNDNSTYDIGATGGAIANGGSMMLTDCTLRNNSTGGGGDGGAIYNSGNMSLTNCTLSGNVNREDAVGGAIANDGTMRLTNCTLSGNSVDDNYSGGAIANAGTLTLTNCTLSGNFSGADGGGIANFRGTATLINTVLACNLSEYSACPNAVCSQNCAFAPVIDGGHNLSADDTCFSGSAPFIDARLAPLGDYGGPTESVALCTADGIPAPSCTGRSPAIDAGDDLVIRPPDNLSTDQRGLPRRSGLHVDIGAYEVQGGALEGQLSDVNVCTGDGNGDGSVMIDELIAMIRATLVSAQVGFCPATDGGHGDQITFDAVLAALHNDLNGCPGN